MAPARGDSESDLDIYIELESVTPQLRREDIELARQRYRQIGKRAMSEMMIVESSGSVCTDLGYEPGEAAILQMRANLMNDRRERISASGMTQTEAAQRLGVGQSRVSDLMRSKWEKFSLEMLITLEARMGRQVIPGFAGAVV
jgi:predicted XRE-type DNA-binding protein